MSLRLYVFTPLRRYAVMSLRRYVVMSLCRYVVIARRRRAQSARPAWRRAQSDIYMYTLIYGN